MTTTTRNNPGRARGNSSAGAHTISAPHEPGAPFLWAAYGDALGFISELVSEKGLKRRTRGEALDRLMAWERRVGGRGGVCGAAAGRMLVRRHAAAHGREPGDQPSWFSTSNPSPESNCRSGPPTRSAAAGPPRQPPGNLGKPKALWYAKHVPPMVRSRWQRRRHAYPAPCVVVARPRR